MRHRAHIHASLGHIIPGILSIWLKAATSGALWLIHRHFSYWAIYFTHTPSCLSASTMVLIIYSNTPSHLSILCLSRYFHLSPSSEDNTTHTVSAKDGLHSIRSSTSTGSNTGLHHSLYSTAVPDTYGSRICYIDHCDGGGSLIYREAPPLATRFPYCFKIRVATRIAKLAQFP